MHQFFLRDGDWSTTPPRSALPASSHVCSRCVVCTVANFWHEADYRPTMLPVSQSMARVVHQWRHIVCEWAADYLRCVGQRGHCQYPSPTTTFRIHLAEYGGDFCAAVPCRVGGSLRSRAARCMPTESSLNHGSTILRVLCSSCDRTARFFLSCGCSTPQGLRCPWLAVEERPVDFPYVRTCAKH